MTRIFHRHAPTVLRLVFGTQLIVGGLLLTGPLSAQIGQGRLFQQTQPGQQQPSDVNSVPGYCAEPQNASLPECGGSETTNSQQGQFEEEPGQQNGDMGPAGRSNRFPTSRIPNLNNGPSQYPETESTRSQNRPPAERITEPPTEFQRYVASSVGRMLPIYGAWLFDHVPSTFAPVDHAPVEAGYVVGPGDELDVRIWGQINFGQRLTVDRSGYVFVPQVGPIQVAGLRFSDIEPAMKSAIGRVYRNFNLNVNMGRLRSVQVFLVGQARRPGSYTVSSLSTLVNALFACGGPSPRGSMRHVQLKRNGKVVTDFDLYDLLLKGDKSKDAPLLPGDVIYIPSVGPQVAIAGSIESAAIYELDDKTALGDALAFAGGLSPVAAGQTAILQRVDQHSSLLSQNLQLDEHGLSTTLQNGDIIRLLPVVPRFSNAVTLRGNVADPGRIPWHQGMRITDLIPNKEALLTRDYWRAQNRLGQNLLTEQEQTERQAQMEQQRAGMASQQGRLANQQENRIRPNVYQYSTSADLMGAAPRYREETRDGKSDSSLAAATSLDNAPPIRQFLPVNQVQPAAPDIDWNYAVIERLDKQSLTTHLIPFNLGKAVLDRDPDSNLPLEPDDVVTIFSNSDLAVPGAQQTKYVRLEGEVKQAGVYSVHPGESLRELVARAGGFTPNAYLFGAQFTRESTRREQQKRITEFLDSLERDINTSAATLSGRVVSAQQAAAAQESVASQHSLVDRLRQVPATGRVVLNLQPTSSNVDALPEIALENGDRLYVPNRPATVNVVGTVYNQSSYLYESALRLGDYLNDAGGPTRYADKNHEFVIRADGSVIPSNGRSALFTHGFDSLHMYPGDTLVVPTNVNKTTVLRGLIDWSTVISNFGLGAAAINLLR